MAETKKPKDDVNNSPVNTGIENDLADENGEFYYSAHVVSQGECLIRVSAENGYWWETLWNHADNAELKKGRKNPNVLLPEDRIRVPKVRLKTEDGATEQKHKFKCKIEPSILRLRVSVFDEPLANKPYKLEVEGKLYTGTTNGDGQIEQKVPCRARAGHLVVGEPPEEREYDLQIGDLDPLDTIAGIKERLNNLGYAAGPICDWDYFNNWPVPAFRKALRKFQLNHDLKITGIVDKMTKDALLKTGI
jgi:hypothetical protein